jgi:hypothetical protein
MRKFLLPILSIIFVIGIATFVWATVMGTPHELAAEPCAMCHTPHHATSTYPLWNRLQVLDADTYKMYESPTFDMGVGLSASRDPNPPSSLCLTCHNGIASILVNYPGPCSETDTSYDLEISGCADLDTDLTDDHPISFQYTDAGIVADNLIDMNNFPVAEHPLGTARWALLGTSTTWYPLYSSLQGDRGFECATCHSVHHVEPDYEPVATNQVYFLRHDNTESELCRDCHRNK